MPAIPRLTTLTTTVPAGWAGMDEMSRLVELVTVKQPGAAEEHRLRVVGVPAVNSAAVPISIAVAPLRFVPVTVTSLPPPAAPLVGLTLVTTGAAGTVPGGALDDVAGLASDEDATAVVLDWIRAGSDAAGVDDSVHGDGAAGERAGAAGARYLLPARGCARPSRA